MQRTNDEAARIEVGDRVRMRHAGIFTPIGSVVGRTEAGYVLVRWDITGPQYQSAPVVQAESTLVRA